MDTEYEKMLEAYALTKRFIKQQIDLGFDQLYMSEKSESSSASLSSSKELENFHQSIKNCQECHLHKYRTNLVFGMGSPQANLMFVGEAPGREEDLQGKPFVGRAGQLLDKILQAIDFKREEVYIGNILKCRPPENRDPLPDEVEKCEPYLLKQIEIIKPRIICALGRISAQVLLKTKLPLNQLRGKFHDYHGIRFLVTYHPAALLRYPQYKRQTWEDVQLLRKEYDKLSSS
jgi:uracil-DNA glycosylase family 4